MSARTELAEYLNENLPDVRVLPYYREVDGVEGLMVMVEASEINHTTMHAWTATVAVYVLTDHQDAALAEDALDAALDSVLAALAEYPPSIDSSASRVILNDNKIHGWQINLLIPYAPPQTS